MHRLRTVVATTTAGAYNTCTIYARGSPFNARHVALSFWPFKTKEQKAVEAEEKKKQVERS